ncbi:MAG: hypothetical protein JXL67_08105 [Calditrichaeota bacterium]|nr:hypothetical protein [Calditrichota bacterium]
MKHLIIMLLILGLVVCFFGCSEENVTAPDPNQSNQSLTSFEKKTMVYFNGTSQNIGMLDPGKSVTLPDGRIITRGLVVQTNDIMNDPRVTGIVTWVVNIDEYPDGTDKRWGTGELIIPDVGKWMMPYIGWKRDGYVTYEVDGHGKGDLQGLKAHWTYHKEAVPGVPFDVTGFIIERN